jgi:hypothetical protein
MHIVVAIARKHSAFRRGIAVEGAVAASAVAVSRIGLAGVAGDDKRKEARPDHQREPVGGGGSSVIHNDHLFTVNLAPIRARYDALYEHVESTATHGLAFACQ